MRSPKILFIVPRFREQELYGGGRQRKAGGDDLRVYPSLGVSYLISCLTRSLRDGCDLQLLDANVERVEEADILGTVGRERPDIVALPVTSFTLAVVRRLTGGIRAIWPSARIILGGAHLNKVPADFRHFHADYALVGDCEQSICELVRAIIHKEDPSHVSGIVYCRRGPAPCRLEDLVTTPPAAIPDLDGLPFPDRSRHHASKHVFYLPGGPFTTAVATRGCPFKCLYCGLPHNASHRRRSVGNILRELREIRRDGYEYVSFCDDIFTLDREHTMELCHALITEGGPVRWGCSTRADCVDASLLVHMCRAGCRDIRFGIESGDETVRLGVLNKRISNARCEAAVADARRAGLITTGYFLFGHPGECYAQMQSTVQFALRLPLDYAYFGISMILPGSGLYEIALRERTIDHHLWEDVIFGRKKVHFYVPEGVTLGQMIKLRQRAHRAFYLRPGRLLSQLRSVRSWKELRVKARLGAALVLRGD